MEADDEEEQEKEELLNIQFQNSRENLDMPKRKEF